MKYGLMENNFMDLPIQISRFGDTIVYKFLSDITYKNAYALKEMFVNEQFIYANCICIDLKDVSYIDSSGLGLLMFIIKKARELDKKINAPYVNSVIDNILSSTGFWALFDKSN